MPAKRNAEPMSQGDSKRIKEDALESKVEQLYQPVDASLKQIRLLVVEAGKEDELVRGTFRYVSLLDHPVYQTISYRWGDFKLRAKILLQNVPLNVPASSERALRRMRHKDRRRVLWIDAVCIDQTNEEERSQQVSIMADIYGNTNRNLIWLGEEQPYTKPALSAIHAIDAEIREDTQDYASLRETLYSEEGVIRYADSPLRTKFDAIALNRFLSLEWFHRLWVVQEAALSCSSICHVGPLEIDLRAVLRAVAWLGYKWYHIPADLLTAIDRVSCIFNWADHQYGQFASGSRSFEIVDLLFNLRGFQAFDPRDHVFATIGLLQRYSSLAQIPAALAPDYNASPATVLHRATKYIVQERADLEVLRYVSHRPDEVNEHGIASWAPRWDRARTTTVDPLELLGDWQNADAGAMHESNDLDDELGVLVTKGLIVGSLQEVGAVWRAAKHSEYKVDQLIADADARIASTTTKRSERDAVVAMVLCQGTTRTRSRYQETQAGAACTTYRPLRQQWCALDDKERGTWLEYLQDHDPAALSFEQALVDASGNRVVFTTSF